MLMEVWDWLQGTFVIAFHRIYSLAWSKSLLIHLDYLASLHWGSSLFTTPPPLSHTILQIDHYTYPVFTWVVGIQTLGPYTWLTQLYPLNYLPRFLGKFSDSVFFPGRTGSLCWTLHTASPRRKLAADPGERMPLKCIGGLVMKIRNLHHQSKLSIGGLVQTDTRKETLAHLWPFKKPARWCWRSLMWVCLYNILCVVYCICLQYLSLI